MNVSTSLAIIVGYFALLVSLSWITSRKATADSFYTGDKKSPWYLVAFGMIGASLSGITFISIPGTVFSKGMTYIPIVIGYLFGYLVISQILLPLYYKLNLTSIYGYLKERFGIASYKTGAGYFLLSRLVGASLRLYLVAEVLELFLFKPLGLPYWMGIVCTVLLIWVYTFRGGIKTIIWTDTLQTAAMLLAVGASIYFIKESYGFNWIETGSKILASEYSKVVDWKGFGWGKFGLGLINGAFITIVMTGLDQDMMQKNLSCKNLASAQKNMRWFSVILIPVNIVFLCLGVLLFEYAFDHDILQAVQVEGGTQFLLKESSGLVAEIKPDQLFPSIAAKGYFHPALGVIFLIGLIAAAYSSADSALTSLTTSFTVDILEDKDNKKKRLLSHVGMSVLLIIVIMLFKKMNDDSVVWTLFKMAGYTYGPLLGMYAFGLFTKRKVQDTYVPIVAIVAPIISFLLNVYSEDLLNGYKFGFEILIINGGLTFLGLFLLSIPEGEIQELDPIDSLLQ